MSYTVLNPDPKNPPTYGATYDPGPGITVPSGELAPAAVHLYETVADYGMLPIGLTKVEVVLISNVPTRLGLEVMIPFTLDVNWIYGTFDQFGYPAATNPGKFVTDWNGFVPTDTGTPIKYGFLMNVGDRLVWEYDPSNPPLIIDDGLVGKRRGFGIRNVGGLATGELQINYEWVVLAPRLA